MSQQSTGDNIRGNISGNISGQVAVGKEIVQTSQAGSAEPITDAEWEELRGLFANVRARLTDEAPFETQVAALERVDELEEAVNAEEPDLTTVQYVMHWFKTKLPAMAGLITGVLVNGVVGKLVHAAGDAAVAALDHALKE